MAAPRKSAQQLAAREKARTKARELTERHEKLIDLAAEYFEQQERAEQILAEAQSKADALLAKAGQEADKATAGAAKRVRAMVDAGEARSAVAERLGVSGAEVKRLLDLADGPGSDARGASGQEDTEAA